MSRAVCSMPARSRTTPETFKNMPTSLCPGDCDNWSGWSSVRGSFGEELSGNTEAQLC